MKRYAVVCGIVLGVACAGTWPARTQNVGYLGAACADPDAPTYDYNCPPIWYQDADQKLNVAYQKLLAKLDKKEAALLRESQRGWIKFRDADVKLVVEHYGEGGSLGRSIAAMQAFRLTRDRLKYVGKRLEGFDGW